MREGVVLVPNDADTWSVSNSFAYLLGKCFWLGGSAGYAVAARGVRGMADWLTVIV